MAARWVVLSAVGWIVCSSVSSAEPPWRFVSMPDFLNVDTEYPQAGWEEAISYLLDAVKAEKPDFLVRFVCVGTLTIDKSAESKAFRDARGYFLKRFESSDARGRPVFHNQPLALPRIHLDGTITE